ncbi:MAG: hypothetical protein R3E01_34770 [Pirellulaceae bacterium]
MAIVAFRQFRRQRQTQHLRTPSQASSPRSVTLPQLPSSSTCTFGNYIWYTAFPLKGLVLVQGTRTPQVKRYARHTQKNAPELPIGRFLKSKSLGGNRVILVVLSLALGNVFRDGMRWDTHEINETYRPGLCNVFDDNPCYSFHSRQGVK